MEVTKEHTKIIRRICNKVSKNSGVDVEDLYSECMDKFPRVLKNFDPSLGKPFNAYLSISARGYALNYCRDKSFLSTVKRSKLHLYQQSKKFNSLELAATALCVPLDTLRDITIQVDSSRPYNSINTDNEWMLPPTKPSCSSSSRLLLTELLDEADEKLLEDYYVNEEDKEEMVEIYGEDYESRVKELVDILERHREEFEWET